MAPTVTLSPEPSTNELHERIRIIDQTYSDFFKGRSHVDTLEEPVENCTELCKVVIRECSAIMKDFSGHVRERVLRSIFTNRLMNVTQSTCLTLGSQANAGEEAVDDNVHVLRFGREACIIVWEVLQTPRVVEKHSVFFPVLRKMIYVLWEGHIADLLESATLRGELFLLDPADRWKRASELREARARCISAQAPSW